MRASSPDASAARVLAGGAPLGAPSDTALGAVVAHLQNTQTADFQPANVTWAYFSDLAGARVRDKRERRRLMAGRALAKIDAWRDAFRSRNNAVGPSVLSA